MKYKIIARDGPARLGELEFNKKKFTTPNILFLDSNRFKSPSYSDIIITNNKTDNKKPKLSFKKNIFTENDFDIKNNTNLIEFEENKIAIIKYAYQNFKKSKKFIEMIVKNRERKSYEKIFYIPSVVEPSNLSLLTYLGIDLFDSTRAIINARNKTMFFCNGNINIIDIKENPCSCPICSKLDKNPKEMNFKEILYHNYNILYSELKNVRNHIRKNNIRELVEKRIKSDPHLTTLLRILDQNNYCYLEEKTPLTSNNKLLATNIESLSRPEILRFQKRIINRYKKPKSAKILLLLPCSAKKPYSFSKSHSFFKKAIFSSKNPYVIHEIIITSPLGLVPRELELIYPAANYDIPVTGKWFEEEKKLIKTLLDNYLKENKYKSIISHLTEEMNYFINENVNINNFTCVDHPTSKKSIKKLTDILKDESSKYKIVKKSDRRKENIKEFASYQFGRNTATKLLDGTYIKGRYPYLKIIKNNTQLGMLVKEKGLISLTFDGGKILFETKINIVEISDDFELKGSVFAPGIKKADRNIRIGDEVIIIRKNKLIAVGSSLMTGKEMEKLSYGEAVKIRHIKKN